MVFYHLGQRNQVREHSQGYKECQDGKEQTKATTYIVDSLRQIERFPFVWILAIIEIDCDEEVRGVEVRIWIPRVGLQIDQSIKVLLVGISEDDVASLNDCTVEFIP